MSRRARPVRALLTTATAGALLLVAPSPLDALVDSRPTVSSQAPAVRQDATTAPGLDRAASSRAAPSAWAPEDELVVTDPVRAPHAISDRLVRLADSVPRGGSIEAATYFLDSRRVVRALVEAHERGVAVRVLVDRTRVASSPALRPLARALDRPGDDSWLRRVAGSTRGAGGVMHQKSWLFSQAGSARHVVLVGSYNTSDLADRRSHAVMHQLVGRAVFRTFSRVFDEQARDRDVRAPFRQRSGSGWEAYFLPVGATSPGTDPVVRRLASIPARPGTTLRIAMFSMWDERGRWIAERLASMARRGADISFVAGPTVAADVRAILVAGGVRVRSGCFADGTFTHSKDMSARFVRGGRRQHWTWVGSDNWTSRGLSSDDAVVGVSGRRAHEQFGEAFRRVWHRPDGVPLERCDPLE